LLRRVKEKQRRLLEKIREHSTRKKNPRKQKILPKAKFHAKNIKSLFSKEIFIFLEQKVLELRLEPAHVWDVAGLQLGVDQLAVEVQFEGATLHHLVAKHVENENAAVENHRVLVDELLHSCGQEAFPDERDENRNVKSEGEDLAQRRTDGADRVIVKFKAQLRELPTQRVLVVFERVAIASSGAQKRLEDVAAAERCALLLALLQNVLLLLFVLTVNVAAFVLLDQADQFRAAGFWQICDAGVVELLAQVAVVQADERVDVVVGHREQRRTRQ